MTGTPLSLTLTDEDGVVVCHGVVRGGLAAPAEPTGIDAQDLADYVRSLDSNAISNLVAQRSSPGTSTAGLYLDTIAQLIEAGP